MNLFLGGDLDGDQFFITWHTDIVEQISPQSPMDCNNIQIDAPLNHIPAGTCLLFPLLFFPSGEILILVPISHFTLDEKEIIPALKELFLHLITNTSVGRIANLHQAIAEYYPEGANHNVAYPPPTPFSRFGNIHILFLFSCAKN